MVAFTCMMLAMSLVSNVHPYIKNEQKSMMQASNIIKKMLYCLLCLIIGSVVMPCLSWGLGFMAGINATYV